MTISLDMNKKKTEIRNAELLKIKITELLERTTEEITKSGNQNAEFGRGCRSPIQ